MLSLISNIILGVWLLFDGICYLKNSFCTNCYFAEPVVGIALIVSSWFVFFRPKPTKSKCNIKIFVLVLSTVFFSSFFHWAMNNRTGYLSNSNSLAIIFWFGALLLLLSVFALGKNFSIFPQSRDLIDFGPYRYVRHPMYTAYIIFDTSYWLESQSIVPLLIWCAETFLFYWRAKEEEKLLSEILNDYTEYQRRVPYRLIPGIL